jgi:hypothetical protein
MSIQEIRPDAPSKETQARARFTSFGEYFANLPVTDPLHRLAEGWRALVTGRIRVRYVPSAREELRRRFTARGDTFVDSEAGDPLALYTDYDLRRRGEKLPEEVVLVPDQFAVVSEHEALADMAGVLSRVRDLVAGRDTLVRERSWAAQAEVLVRMGAVEINADGQEALAEFPEGLASLPLGVWEGEY